MLRLFCQILLLTGIIAIFAQCNRGSEYLEMEARELKSGIRHDSLFFGLYLGMSAKDFYGHCWELNKQGIIRQGANNTSVYYKIDEWEHAAGMDFYPTFHEDKIVSMPIVFSYDAWAPWNKHLYADSLRVDVLTLMENWYGPGFIEIRNPTPIGGNAFVKVNGNRRISIYNSDDRAVKVDIVDLTILKSLEAKAKEIGD